MTVEICVCDSGGENKVEMKSQAFGIQKKKSVSGMVKKKNSKKIQP